MNTIEIAYGPQHNEQVSAFIGQPFTQWGDNPVRVFDTCIYVRPYWKAYALSGGRVLVAVQKAMSDFYYLMDNTADFYQWKEAGFAAMPDPETGRVAVR